MTGTFTGGATHGIAVGPGDRSAPRAAVILQLVSPGARGRFSRAIVESGTGSPSPLTWSRFDPAGRQVLSLIPPRPHVETSFSAEHQCAFWALA
jgi:hypothetical protein